MIRSGATVNTEIPVANDAEVANVRISVSGDIRPLAAEATEHLRSRAGEHRVLPSPEHVVLMRRVSRTSGARRAGDGVVRLAGEIVSPGSMCDIIGLLGQTGWRGELVVLEGATERRLYLEGGSVVGAESNQASERLEQVMYRFGALSAEQLEQTTAMTRVGVPSPKALAELEFASVERVYEYLKRQIEEIAAAILTIGDGTFFFMAGFDEKRLTSRQMVCCNALLMDAVTRMDEIRYFRERIPGTDYVPVRVTGLPPSEALREVYEQIDGRLDVEQLGRITGKGVFGVTKDLFALAQTRTVSIRPPSVGGAKALVREANRALAFIHERAERGRYTSALKGLRAFAEGLGKPFHGAGPRGDGTLDVERVAQNALRHFPVSEQAEAELGRMLHEYVAFALFAAWARANEEDQAELDRVVTRHLSRLRTKECAAA